VQKKSSKKAFSIIELSIVAVIVSALIGGVIAANRISQTANLAAARSLTKNSPVPTINGLVLWLETTMPQSFSESEADDGAQISTWYDLSPEKDNGTQTTSSYQPLYTANGINNLPSVKFDGTNDWMDLRDGLLDNPGNWTTFVVSQRLGTSTGDEYMISTSGVVRYYIRSSPTAIYFYTGSGTAVGGVIMTTNRTTSLVAIYSSNNAFTTTVVTSNAYNITTSINATFSGVVDRFCLGSYVEGGGSWANAYIGEVIMFNRPLSAAEQADVRHYLEKKWGLYIY